MGQSLGTDKALESGSHVEYFLNAWWSRCWERKGLLQGQAFVGQALPKVKGCQEKENSVKVPGGSRGVPEPECVKT